MSEPDQEKPPSISSAKRRAISKGASNPFAKKTYVKKKSSNETIVVLLVLVILGAIVFVFLNKPKKELGAGNIAAEQAEKQGVIVIGDPPPPGSQSPVRRSARHGESSSPIIPMVMNSGPVVEQGFKAQDFLEKARVAVRAPIATDLRKYEEDVEKNAKAFQASLMELTTGWEDERRQAAETNLSREVEYWSEHNFLISEELPLGFRESFTAKNLHEKFLKTQESLREPLDPKISEQIKPYVIGLEYQIGLLKDTDNETAIRSLEEEIDKVNNSTGYFASLMLK